MNTLENTLSAWQKEGDTSYEQWIEVGCEGGQELGEIFNHAFNGTLQQRKRACWILHHISDRNKNVLIKYVPRMVRQLDVVQTEAEQRFILRFFANHYIPDNEELKGTILNHSFSILNNPESGIAPRVYAMSTLHKLTYIYPEIAHELAESIQYANENGSAGMRSRGRKILLDLKKRDLI